MHKGGQYVMQAKRYKAFIPAPVPRVELSPKAEELLVEAERLLPELNTLAVSLPNHALFLSMYVRKEALLRPSLLP